MKRLLVAVTVVSMMVLLAGAAMAEMRQAPKSPTTTTGATGISRPALGGGAMAKDCPPGFSIDNSNPVFTCIRSKPANPCAPGYHVKWGACQANCSMNDTRPECQTCAYQCLPDMPSKPANVDCHKFGNYHEMQANFCWVGCREVPQ